VHTGMGGTAGAAFAAILKREFPSVSATEIIEIQSAIAARDRVGKIKEQVASRAWSEEEKKQLLTLFMTIDADGSGSISRQSSLRSRVSHSLAGPSSAERLTTWSLPIEGAPRARPAALWSSHSHSSTISSPT